MSYRKKHYPAKPEKKKPDFPINDVEYGNSGTERSLYTGRLTSGLPYQRPVDEKEVDRLIREWDERLLDPLVVSFRDGKFNLVDGQHRVAAMRKKNGGNEVMAVCKIYSGLTYKQEAELCYKLDKAKKRLSLSQSTNALAESGTDDDVAEIKRLVERNGFRWALGKRSGKEHEIIATRAVINAYRLLGANNFSRMLRLLENTWHGEAHSLHAVVISGLALFIKTYDEELNERIFIKRLSAVSPDEIIRRGKLDYSTNDNALRYARVILEKYNATRSNDQKRPYRFSG